MKYAIISGVLTSLQNWFAYEKLILKKSWNVFSKLVFCGLWERNLITFDYIELLKDDFKKMHESAASSSSKCLIVIWQSSIHFHNHLLLQECLFEMQLKCCPTENDHELFKGPSHLWPPFVTAFTSFSKSIEKATLPDD